MLRRHKEFTEMLSRMLHADDVNRCVMDVLEEIMASVKANRIYIFEYDLENACQHCTFEVVSSPEYAEKDSLQGIPLDATPWWNGQLMQDRSIQLCSLDELPPEASSEYEILNAQGIKSLYVEPLIVNRQVWGYIGMDFVQNSHCPNPSEIEWLSALAGVISLNIRFVQIREKERQERQQLLVAKQQAEEANRLKSAFLANMSHEIRTPLNLILNFSELLVETQAEADRKEYYEVIKRNSESLLNLINGILDLSKIEAGKFTYHLEKCDVRQLCQTIVEEMRYKAPNGVELISLFGELLPIIETDPLRLKQVLVNLLNNAMKFTSKGSITVSCRQENSEYLRFEVADTGIGIRKDDIPRLFERFFQSDSFVNGCGLGLPISQNIISHLGGEIGVESELGKGSTFWFTLPINSPGKIIP